MDVLTTSELIRKRECSPVELVKKTLAKIAEENPKNNSFITVSEAESIHEAIKLEEELISGKYRGILHGIPIALKDLIFTKKLRTTMGSKVFKDYVPDIDAAVVEKLKEAGAIIIGKTNTHEFAYGPIGDRSYFGPCRNPYNLDKISGGSSSGSAAAVASGMVMAALGTDTGGSIRIPSAACGVVGMKPTFGLVSKRGVFDLAYTLDHVGPITNTIKDNAVVLNAIAGFDSKDPYSISTAQKDYASLIGKELKGLKIGLPSFYYHKIDKEVFAAVTSSVKQFETMGVSSKTVEISCLEEIAAAQTITIQAEAAAVHIDTIQQHKEAMDEEVYERLLASRDVKGYEYVQAQIKKNQLINQFNVVFQDVDILVVPALPILPTNIGQREVEINGEKESVRHALLRLTSPTNYTGNPSLTMPCGFSKSGLPIGIQMIAKHGNEEILYQAGYALEQSKGKEKM
ncbi:amidase [Neobacillus sp. SM06]|uniref:amidase n=1 Tax=Neobacillus sp. SM06 TaxID=3422492 RepID=UPI003D2BE875